VIEKIAEIKKMDYKKIEKETDKNAVKFFDLKII
jgi:Tat protein secretion system quality control protein TatD with DNase activity